MARYKRAFKKKKQTGGPTDPPFSTFPAPDYRLPSNLNMVTSGLSARSDFLPRDLNRAAPQAPNVPAQQPEDTIFSADFNFGLGDSPATGGGQPTGETPIGQAQTPATTLSSPAATPDIGGMTASPEVGGASGGGGEANFGVTDVLQFAPEIMNFATGVLGRDKTPPPTRVSDRAVGDMPTKFNINPQLEQARSAYRSILADPNASTTEKLAAQAQLNTQTSRLYAEKANREAQMQSNKAQLQSQIDRQNAGFRSQARQDEMASEANLGVSGNFARQALTSASQKLLQQQAMEGQKQQANKELMTIISAYPEAVQKRILNDLELDG